VVFVWRPQFKPLVVFPTLSTLFFALPYLGWQFPGEDVFIAASKGARLNCFGLISRSNQCYWTTTTDSIDAAFIVEQLERLSFQITRPTCLVLDCARIHTGKQVQERRHYWQERGLYLLYLPPYSPQLNLAETLWRKLKSEWLTVEDYLEQDRLFYATNRCLASVGTHLSTFTVMPRPSAIISPNLISLVYSVECP
jgi:transposase